MKIKCLNFLLSFIVVTTLSACGFQLRGQHALPPNLHCLKLESPTLFGDFESTLRRCLTQLGLNIIYQGPSPITLHILNTALFQDVPTIGGSNQARVYVYYFRVIFEILDACRKPIVTARSVTASGTLIINAGTALEATNQLAVLQQELQVETSHMIINVLNSPLVSCAPIH